ncbi:MAG: hypothetical protein ACXAC7_08600, partial [Candidatus Hodarchaeales archaeon]
MKIKLAILILCAFSLNLSPIRFFPEDIVSNDISDILSTINIANNSTSTPSQEDLSSYNISITFFPDSHSVSGWTNI